jgi:prepilin-type N-terminal cleavage/methylation domain-containing protein
MKLVGPRKSAFTLIELLVVIGIIALLGTMMLPAFGIARQLARGGACMTNLHGVGQGLVMYQTANDETVVPSFNMPRWGTYSAQAGDVVDGWAAILDRDGFIRGTNGLKDNIFYCPETTDQDGMAGGQTGYDQNKPNGYQDWPVQFLAAGGDGVAKGDPNLPRDEFGDAQGPYIHEIRCGYFINAYNPIGSAPAAGTSVPACDYYTQTVGYGPYPGGGSLGLLKAGRIQRPSAMIVACDGMYMGRQSVVRLGEQNRRIGYRHRGRAVNVNVNGTMTHFDKTVTNTVFADGHTAAIHNDDFPHGNVPTENSGNYSLLADQ